MTTNLIPRRPWASFGRRGCPSFLPIASASSAGRGCKCLVVRPSSIGLTTHEGHLDAGVAKPFAHHLDVHVRQKEKRGTIADVKIPLPFATGELFCHHLDLTIQLFVFTRHREFHVRTDSTHGLGSDIAD